MRMARQTNLGGGRDRHERRENGRSAPQFSSSERMVAAILARADAGIGWAVSLRHRLVARSPRSRGRLAQRSHLKSCRDNGVADLVTIVPSRITLDPKVLLGKPVIRGTRLSVEFVIGLMA